MKKDIRNNIYGDIYKKKIRMDIPKKTYKEGQITNDIYRSIYK